MEPRETPTFPCFSPSSSGTAWLDSGALGPQARRSECVCQQHSCGRLGTRLPSAAPKPSQSPGRRRRAPLGKTQLAVLQLTKPITVYGLASVSEQLLVQRDSGATAQAASVCVLRHTSACYGPRQHLASARARLPHVRVTLDFLEKAGVRRNEDTEASLCRGASRKPASRKPASQGS